MTTSIQPSLETELIEKVTCKVDIGISLFHDCLKPNEIYPIRLAEHLQLAEKGIIVTCGTERSFFDLIHCQEDKCEALVICDINPRVKAYVDFNILLLRICDSAEDYRILSDEYSDEIIKRLSSAPMSNQMRRYYLDNISSFASVYYSVSKEWRVSIEYYACHYHLNERQFQKLHRYAKEGKIVSTMNSINEIGFLSHKRISVVDTSNILDYSIIDLECLGPLQPRVVFTRFYPRGTIRDVRYFSHIHKSLSIEQKEQYKHLLKRVCDYTGKKDPHTAVHSLLKMDRFWRSLDCFNRYHGLIVNQESMHILEGCLQRLNLNEN